MSGARGGALDHRRGRAQHPEQAVHAARRARLHPLGQRGREFIAEAVKRWLEVSGVRTLYIEAGSPWENAYSETFISRFGDELLKREVFSGLLEAKVLVEE